MGGAWNFEDLKRGLNGPHSNGYLSFISVFYVKNQCMKKIDICNLSLRRNFVQEI